MYGKHTSYAGCITKRGRTHHRHLFFRHLFFDYSCHDIGPVSCWYRATGSTPPWSSLFRFRLTRVPYAFYVIFRKSGTQPPLTPPAFHRINTAWPRARLREGY